MKYAFIQHNRRVWPISVQCGGLEVSVSGYHEHLARRRRILERRHLSDAAVLVHIRAVFAENRGAYGIRKTLFAPYMTTKQAGTGLGLWLSRLIADISMEGSLGYAAPRLSLLGQALRATVSTGCSQPCLQGAACHPSLLSQAVKHHSIRPTTATHLLRSRVDINTVRAWLGGNLNERVNKRGIR